MSWTTSWGSLSSGSPKPAADVQAREKTSPDSCTMPPSLATRWCVHLRALPGLPAFFRCGGFLAHSCVPDQHVAGSRCRVSAKEAGPGYDRVAAGCVVRDGIAVVHDIGNLGGISAPVFAGFRRSWEFLFSTGRAGDRRFHCLRHLASCSAGPRASRRCSPHPSRTARPGRRQPGPAGRKHSRFLSGRCLRSHRWENTKFPCSSALPSAGLRR